MTTWHRRIHSTRTEKGWSTTPCLGVQGIICALEKNLLLQPLKSEPFLDSYLSVMYLKFSNDVFMIKAFPGISSQELDQNWSNPSLHNSPLYYHFSPAFMFSVIINNKLLCSNCLCSMMSFKKEVKGNRGQSFWKGWLWQASYPITKVKGQSL